MRTAWFQLRRAVIMNGACGGWRTRFPGSFPALAGAATMALFALLDALSDVIDEPHLAA
jgi:hypothetical protein